MGLGWICLSVIQKQGFKLPRPVLQKEKKRSLKEREHGISTSLTESKYGISTCLIQTERGTVFLTQQSNEKKHGIFQRCNLTEREYNI
jgi:hypothetical protein